MKEKSQPGDDKLSKSTGKGTLILLNDDVNTFDHVIKALVEVCGHDRYQAEQCATIVHYKGSCEVKKGVASVIKLMGRTLESKGLKIRIEA